MNNILEQMRDTAIEALKQKIQWRKDRIAESEKTLLSKLFSDEKTGFTLEQTCSGLVSLRGTLTELENLLAQLESPPQPAKAKRGRPRKKK